MAKSKYKNSEYYKSLLKHIKSLNDIILCGDEEQKKLALEERDKLLEPADEIKDVCIVRELRKKNPVKYTYVTKKNNINNNDICVIYKLKSAE